MFLLTIFVIVMAIVIGYRIGSRSAAKIGMSESNSY